jgi:endonuclease V-like protein UPF0215 family
LVDHRQIAQAPAGIPVIVVATRGAAVERDGAVRAVLNKPLRRDALRLAIEQVLEPATE